MQSTTEIRYGKRTAKLPVFDSVAAIVRVVIADGRKVLGDLNYTPDAYLWHTRENVIDGTCHVCLAGCLIAGVLREKREFDLSPGSYEPFIRGFLSAADFLRNGSVSSALLKWSGYVTRPYEVTPQETQRITAVIRSAQTQFNSRILPVAGYVNREDFEKLLEVLDDLADFLERHKV